MRSAPEIAALCTAGVVPNLAYLAIGLPLQRALRLGGSASERTAVAYLLGTGAASLAFLVLRAANLPIPILGLGAVALALFGISRFAMALWPPPPRPPGREETPPCPGWIRWLELGAAVVAGLLFASALGPEVGWDSLEYHLPIVRAWSEGPIRALPGVLDAEFRSGVDLLYLPAVAAGQSDAAASVSACFAAALAALVHAEASRRSSRGAAAWAGLLVLLTPLCLRTAITADVDLAVGAYGFLALMAADRWNRGGDRPSLLLCALALAFAANAKLHAAILIPAVGLLLLSGGRLPALGDWLRGAALTAALTLPWLVKVGLTTGNPLFPLFGDLLGYGATTAEHLAGRRTTLLQAFPSSRDPAGLLRWLGFVALGPEAARGEAARGSLLGPLPFALAPLAFGRWSRATVALCGVLLLLLLLQFGFMRPVRFGIPIWAFAAVAAAVGGARLARSGTLARSAVGAGLIGVTLLGAGSLLPDAAARVAAIRNPVPFREAAWPDQIALREMVEAADPMVAISMGAALWMPKPVYNLHWERNGELFFQGSSPEQVHSLLRRRGVRSVVLTVNAPLPGDGRVGHPTVDAWLRSGRARLRPDVPPRVKRGSRVWVLVELQ